MGALKSESADPILGMPEALDSARPYFELEQPVIDTNPDGGTRAWLVVVGGFLTFFVTFGQSVIKFPSNWCSLDQQLKALISPKASSTPSGRFRHTIKRVSWLRNQRVQSHGSAQLR